MSCFFAERPYALSRTEIESRAAADFFAILTCPIWLPIAGVVLGGMYAHGYYVAYNHKRSCEYYISKLRNITITDNSVYWRTNNTIYVIRMIYNDHLDLSTSTTESIIRKTWMKGINYVLAAVAHPLAVTIEFIEQLERLERLEQANENEENDTIIVVSSVFDNIANQITYGLSDGYYGIFANKFNIVTVSHLRQR